PGRSYFESCALDVSPALRAAVEISVPALRKHPGICGLKRVVRLRSESVNNRIDLAMKSCGKQHKANKGELPYEFFHGCFLRRSLLSDEHIPNREAATAQTCVRRQGECRERWALCPVALLILLTRSTWAWIIPAHLFLAPDDLLNLWRLAASRHAGLLEFT